MTTAGEQAWEGIQGTLIVLGLAVLVAIVALVFYLGFRAGYAAGRAETPASMSTKGAP